MYEIDKTKTGYSAGAFSGLFFSFFIFLSSENLILFSNFGFRASYFLVYCCFHIDYEKKLTSVANSPEKLLRIFGDGICLDNHVSTYIEACFQDIPFQDLIDRICNNPDFEDAPLMELIFFPDEALQVQLEPLLEKNVFGIEDEKALARLLLEAGIQTTLLDNRSNAAAIDQNTGDGLHPLSSGV